MRLRKLWVGNFYNLRDIEIDFNNAASMYGSTGIRFFVGLNGAGKSNALMAIGLIFSHLAADASPGIEFDLEYELLGQIIRITTCNRPDDVVNENDKIRPIDAALLVRKSSELKWTREHVLTAWSSSGNGIKPGRVVGYSTGPTSGLQWALTQSIERIIRENISPSLDDEEQQRELWEEEYKKYTNSPTTMFIDSDNALSAVVALLAYDEFEGEADLQSYTERRKSILERVKLDLDEPLAAFTVQVSGKWKELLDEPSKTRFSILLRAATVLREIESERDFNPDDPKDFYAVFDVDQTLRRDALGSIFGTPLAFFEDLLLWHRRSAVNSIRLVIKKQNVNPLLPETALSDGEYLYLGRFAVLLMLRDIPESLILLDEPETHFNDQWKVELVNDVYTLLQPSATLSLPQNEFNSEVIIATHSDLTLTDADSKQIYLFEEYTGSTPSGTQTRIKVQNPPRMSTFAANRGEISRVIFGTLSSGRFSTNQIEQALLTGSKEEVEDLIDETGPGFAQFQLMDKLVEFDESEEGGNSAPSDK